MSKNSKEIGGGLSAISHGFRIVVPEIKETAQASLYGTIEIFLRVFDFYSIHLEGFEQRGDITE